MLERTLVYVDTSYLLASFYNSWETGARGQLEIDLREVVHVLDRMITAQLDQPVQRQLWYDGLPESGPHRYQRQLRTIDGVRLRAGQLIEWGDRRTQKAVDTRLVADMVIAALRDQVTDMVLVSGDADMLPGVNEAAGAGVRVHLYGFGWDSMSSALRHACDTTTILDPREDFAECMQLNVLEGPLPPVVRAKPVGDAEPPEDLGATPVAEFRGGADRTAGAAPEGSAPAAEVAKDPDPAPADGGDCAPAPATPTARAPEPQPTPDAAARPGSAAAGESNHGDPGTPAASPAPAAPAEAAPAGDAAAGGAAATPEPDHPGADGDPAEDPGEAAADPEAEPAEAPGPKPAPRPNPSMMAPRRKLRSRYVPLPNEVWGSAGFQTPFDVGKQYASWWFESAATEAQRDDAHLLSGGGLPADIDRPLLQFACETLHEYTLDEGQRVNLRDGFHAGIRAILLTRKRDGR